MFRGPLGKITEYRGGLFEHPQKENTWRTLYFGKYHDEPNIPRRKNRNGIFPSSPSDYYRLVGELPCPVVNRSKLNFYYREKLSWPYHSNN